TRRQLTFAVGGGWAAQRRLRCRPRPRPRSAIGFRRRDLRGGKEHESNCDLGRHRFRSSAGAPGGIETVGHPVPPGCRPPTGGAGGAAPRELPGDRGTVEGRKRRRIRTRPHADPSTSSIREGRPLSGAGAERLPPWQALGRPGALLAGTIAAIGPLDDSAMVAARRREDELTKPPGSLGRLEEIAVRLAGITGHGRPRLRQKAVVVAAADHGVAAEGVSAYPVEVTAQMVANFLGGGAAIN